MKKLFALCFLFMLTISLYAQTNKNDSCCGDLSKLSGKMDATDLFAGLGNDNAFRGSHMNPKPFLFTSDKGKIIEITSPDGKKAKVYEVKASRPTKNYLLMVHEWWGLNDYIKQEAVRYQQELGDVNVLAVDMYDGQVATDREMAEKLMSAHTKERGLTILQAAINYAGKDARIATIGWCFGGGWSLQAAILAGNQGKAGVIYYGMPEMDTEKLKTLTAKILGIFAKKDGWITPEVASKFEEAMKSVNKSVTIKLYDADHAFANPSTGNTRYDEKSAKEAEEVTFDFLRKELRLLKVVE